MIYEIKINNKHEAGIDNLLEYIQSNGADKAIMSYGVEDFISYNFKIRLGDSYKIAEVSIITLRKNFTQKNIDILKYEALEKAVVLAGFPKYSKIAQKTINKNI